MSRKDTDSVQLNTLERDGKNAQENVIEVGGTTAAMGGPSDKSSEDDSPIDRAEEDLKAFRTMHEWDPNLEREPASTLPNRPC